MSDSYDEISPPEEATAPAWMATFGDLMSLLLTFFVLLMSFASMDVRRFAAVVGSMRDAFGVQRLHPGHIESLSDSLVQLSDTESTPFMRVIDVPTRIPEREQSMMARIEMTLKEQKLQRVVQIEHTPDGVVIRVPDAMLFDSGSADLRPGAVVLLREIASLIQQTPGDVAVRGHSDASPISSGGFRSNWELSTDRAVAAVVHLVEVEGVDERRLRASGFGATRPLARDGDDRSADRRVEFVFLHSLTEIQSSDRSDAQDEEHSS